MTKRSLWIACILGSLAIHAGGLYFLARHPLSFSLSSLFHKQGSSVSALEEQEIADSIDLEAFFQTFPLHAETPLATQEPLSPHPLSIYEENIALELLLPTQITELAPLGAHAFFSAIPAFSLELLPYYATISPSPSTLSFEALPPQPSTLIEDDTPPQGISAPQIIKPPIDIARQKPSIFFESADLTLSAPQATTHSAFSWLLPIPLNPCAKTPLLEQPTCAKNINDFLPLSSLFPLQWDHHLSIAPSFMPCEEGYLFALAITPTSKALVSSPKLKQTIYFLIDVSSTLDKHKIATFKKSILRSLASLDTHHSFNIILLDKELHALHETSLPCSPESITLAKTFLDTQCERAWFASEDLFQQVERALDLLDTTEDLHTVIVFTNGSSSSSLKDKGTALTHVIDKSAGRVQCFTAAVGQNNTLVHLDMLSSLCGGTFLYADTNASFPRKLQTFLHKIQSPLLKDLSITLQADDPKAEITILSSPLQLPCLYQDTPLVILGKTSKLCHLHCMLEGQTDEGWVLVQKDVSFDHATQGGSLLMKQLASLQAVKLYTNFLEHPERIYLEQAEELLASLRKYQGRE